MAKKREAVSAMQDRGWWSQDELARQTKLSQPAISKLSLFCGFFGGFFVFFYPFRGFFGVFLGASLASSLFLSTSEASLASSRRFFAFLRCFFRFGRRAPARFGPCS